MKKIDRPGVAIAKEAAGRAAAELIQNGMLVGLGTGSTAAFFITALGKRCQEGLKISAAATSNQSTLQAEHWGIPILASEAVTTLDVTVDGADEIDPFGNMIKGGGGALLREKLMAKASKEMIVIVDQTKCVDHLGRHPLPVEIIPFVYQTTLLRLKDKGYQGYLRFTSNNSPFMTDNGNYIFDIQYNTPILNPEHEHNILKGITGVVETGFFFHIAKKVIIGYEDGSIKLNS